MAIELHHLNTHVMMEQAGKVLDGVVRLKERIAELEKENESLKYSVASLETDLAMSQRWRKCSEELPEEYTDVLFVYSDGTYYLGDMWIISTDGVNPAEQYWSGRGEPRCNNPKYWLPLPSAPEEEK